MESPTLIAAIELNSNISSFSDTMNRSDVSYTLLASKRYCQFAIQLLETIIHFPKGEFNLPLPCAGSILRDLLAFLEVDRRQRWLWLCHLRWTQRHHQVSQDPAEFYSRNRWITPKLEGLPDSKIHQLQHGPTWDPLYPCVRDDKHSLSRRKPKLRWQHCDQIHYPNREHRRLFQFSLPRHPRLTNNMCFMNNGSKKPNDHSSLLAKRHYECIQSMNYYKICFDWIDNSLHIDKYFYLISPIPIRSSDDFGPYEYTFDLNFRHILSFFQCNTGSSKILIMQRMNESRTQITQKKMNFRSVRMGEPDHVYLP